ncbi:hypothetical protein A2U01_0094689, partial [Trifolium medium]|nr:hypothetical protein [Trifolium medium]
MFETMMSEVVTPTIDSETTVVKGDDISASRRIQIYTINRTGDHRTCRTLEVQVAFG